MRPFILVHGPLVGPFTWVPVAAELRKLGATAVIPALNSPAGREGTYWQHHCDLFATEMADVSMDTSEAVLVGHEGAGPLLPKLGEHIDGPAAYVLVDADLPKDGASLFDMFEDEADIEEFRRAAGEVSLPRGRHAPTTGRRVATPETVREWPLDLLADAVAHQPDNMADVNSTVFAGRRPTPIEVLEEPLPVPATWPDAPVGYLHLTKTYDGAAAQAAAAGWPVRELQSSHVQMLHEPESFARELAALAEELAG